MIMTSTRSRRHAAATLGAMTASAALVLGGLSSASAADFQLGPDDVAGFENDDTYNQWHIGSVSNPDLDSTDSLAFRDCSVRFEPVPEESGTTNTDTQLLQGTANEERDTVADIEALFDSLEVDINANTEGGVTLQVPLFIFTSDEDGTPDFTTVRTATSFVAPGTETFTDTPLTSSRSVVLGEFENSDALLEELRQREDEGASFELLGFGVSGAVDAEINTVSALGDTFYFGDGDCLPDQPGNGGDDGDDGSADGDDSGATPQAPTRPTAVETGR